MFIFVQVDEVIDVSEITPDVLQLFFDRLSDSFRCALFALGEIQVILSGVLTIHSRLVKVVFVAFRKEILPSSLQPRTRSPRTCPIGAFTITVGLILHCIQMR